MAAPKPLKYLSGALVEGEVQDDNPAIPLNNADVAQTILQLQNTVNELISVVNANAGSGETVTGTPVTATDLFTAQ